MTGKFDVKANAKATMRQWFLRNYESVEENTPRDDGEWIYIYGGPVDPKEELQEQFGGVFADELIEEVCDDIEDEFDYEWVPVPPPEEEWKE